MHHSRSTMVVFLTTTAPALPSGVAADQSSEPAAAVAEQISIGAPHSRAVVVARRA